MKNIIVSAHCILNVATKVVLYNKEEIEGEENLRLKFLRQAIEKGVQFIQLPCPEFTLYGADRWGHVSNQFDNPFFRNHCRKILNPVLDEFEEYLNHPERFKILGIIGIDGSPSCGVDYTCTGSCYGSFSGRDDLNETLSEISIANKNGIFIDELKKLLEERKIQIPIIGLFANEPEKCMDLLKGI